MYQDAPLINYFKKAAARCTRMYYKNNTDAQHSTGGWRDGQTRARARSSVCGHTRPQWDENGHGLGGREVFTKLHLFSSSDTTTFLIRVKSGGEIKLDSSIKAKSGSGVRHISSSQLSLSHSVQCFSSRI